MPQFTTEPLCRVFWQGGGAGRGGEKVCLRVQDAFLLNEIITILKPLFIAVEVTSVLRGKK